MAIFALIKTSGIILHLPYLIRHGGTSQLSERFTPLNFFGSCPLFIAEDDDKDLDTDEWVSSTDESTESEVEEEEESFL